MEGMAGQPSNNYNLSIPGVPTSLDLSSPCTTWEEVRHLLLWQVPATHLPSWEVLWRWDQLKASVTSGQADPTTLNQRVMGFCRRVEGTREAHQCLVPEQEGRRGVLCEKVINRLDRMRSHIRSDHLAAPGIPCEGQCGNNDCGKEFRTRQNLKQHVNPAKEPCSQCGKVMYKRNMSTHRC